MSKNKVVKSVSFNITEEQDQVFLDFIKDKNFSGYVKRLIEKDMKSRPKIIKASDQVQKNSNSSGLVIIGSGSALSLK